MAGAVAVVAAVAAVAAVVARCPRPANAAQAQTHVHAVPHAASVAIAIASAHAGVYVSHRHLHANAILDHDHRLEWVPAAAGPLVADTATIVDAVVRVVFFVLAPSAVPFFVASSVHLQLLVVSTPAVDAGGTLDVVESPAVSLGDSEGLLVAAIGSELHHTIPHRALQYLASPALA